MVGELAGFGNCVNFNQPISYDQSFDNSEMKMEDFRTLKRDNNSCDSICTTFYISSSSIINQALNNKKGIYLQTSHLGIRVCNDNK